MKVYGNLKEALVIHVHVASCNFFTLKHVFCMKRVILHYTKASSYQISFTAGKFMHFFIEHFDFLSCTKIAGTATEETWPGVTRLPEYNAGNDQLTLPKLQRLWERLSLCYSFIWN